MRELRTIPLYSGCTVDFFGRKQVRVRACKIKPTMRVTPLSIAVMGRKQVRVRACKIKPTMRVTPLSIVAMVLGTNELIL